MNAGMKFAALNRFFPGEIQVKHSLGSLNMLRILLGFILTYRNSWVLVTSYYYYEFFSPLALVSLFISVCIMLGCFTPLMLGVNVFLANRFDHAFEMGTLGTSILTIVQITMLFLGTGSELSLDSRWLKGEGWRPDILKKLYGNFGVPDSSEIKFILLIAFFGYGLMSLGAVGKHIYDPFWSEGQTTRILLVSAYLCPAFEFFRDVELSYPGFFEAVSKISIVGQTIFQALMLPLVFTTFGRKFVVIWGYGFFLFSLLFLQLSYLPFFELILWSLIFPVIPFKKLNRWSIELAALPSTKFSKWAVFGWFLLQWAFIPVLPFFEKNTEKVLGKKFTGYYKSSMVAAGLQVPDVFNAMDLMMERTWYTLERIPPGEFEKLLVPVNSAKGERMWYHQSDILYFESSMYRRVVRGIEPYHEPSKTIKALGRILKVAKFDYRFTGQMGEVRYFLRIYRNEVWNLKLPVKDRFKTRECFSGSFLLDQHQTVKPEF